MKEVKESINKIKYKRLTDLSLYHAGFEECAPSKSCGPFIREFDVIHFVFSGTGILTIENKTYQISEGSAFIIPSNTVSFYQADCKNPWSYAWIGYIGFSAYNYSLQLATSGKQRFILENIDTQFYKQIIQEAVVSDVFTKNKYFQANSLLFTLMNHLYEELKIETIANNHFYLAEEIKFFIDYNYTENLKIKEIAQIFNIHPNYLSNIFYDSFQISPKSYLIEKKINKACELLALTDLPITIIANSIGYEDIFSFSRLFKQKKYISPSNYRKKLTHLRGTQ